MKQGKTVNGSIITLNNNTVNIIDINCNYAKSITFLSEEKAKQYYYRNVVHKKRGAKPFIKHPQATIRYDQLIIQL